MKIIVDLDNVIFDYSGVYRLIVEEIPDISERDALRLMVERDLIATMNTLEDAVESVNDLFNEGNQIVFATLRSNHWFPDGKAEEHTKRALEYHRISYHLVHHAADGQTKRAIYEEEKPDIVVDDQEFHIYEAKLAKVPGRIHFGRPRTRNLGRGRFDVANWTEARKAILDYQNTAKNKTF